MESKVRPINKKRQLAIHKLAVLIELMCDELEEVNANSQSSKQILAHSKALKEILEPMLANIYDSSTIGKTTYMQELTSKVDTVIRKSFIHIE